MVSEIIPKYNRVGNFHPQQKSPKWLLYSLYTLTQLYTIPYNGLSIYPLTTAAAFFFLKKRPWTRNVPHSHVPHWCNPLITCKKFEALIMASQPTPQRNPTPEIRD